MDGVSERLTRAAESFRTAADLYVLTGSGLPEGLRDLADACDAMAKHVAGEDERIRRAVEEALAARMPQDDGR